VRQEKNAIGTRPYRARDRQVKCKPQDKRKGGGDQDGPTAQIDRRRYHSDWGIAVKKQKGKNKIKKGKKKGKKFNVSRERNRSVSRKMAGHRGTVRTSKLLPVNEKAWGGNKIHGKKRNRLDGPLRITRTIRGGRKTQVVLTVSNN